LHAWCVTPGGHWSRCLGLLAGESCLTSLVLSVSALDKDEYQRLHEDIRKRLSSRADSLNECNPTDTSNL
jgi:hypothetical protein